MRHDKIMLGAALAVGALHMALVVSVSLDSTAVEGSWRGFSLFLLDFPLSIAFLSASPEVLPWLHAVFGSAWWGGIAWILLKGLKALLERSSLK